jgi:hypothetical protein
MKYKLKQLRFFEVEAESPEEAVEIFQEAFDSFDEGRYETETDQINVVEGD